jgi:hypothetical protein
VVACGGHFRGQPRGRVARLYAAWPRGRVARLYAAWPRGRVARLYAVYNPGFLFSSCPFFGVFMAKPLETKDFACPKIVQKKLKK